ncbi:MAG: hypothetical protein WC322_01430 [Candidatus Paceibacterota bacterium]|jgi:hypothetical protein
MALARWQRTIVDDAGNILPGASVEVRREISGAPLAVLYSDRDGLVSIGNPFSADLTGFARFHVIGGAYKITVTSGSFTQTLRYVGVGLSGETDGSVVPGLSYLFDTSVVDANPGNGVIRFNNATLGSVTQIYASETVTNGVNVASYLATFDDAGSGSNRGTFQIISDTGYLLASLQTLTDDGSYYQFNVTVLASGGAFSIGQTVGLTFYPNGTASTGDVVGPGGATADTFPLYNGTTGKLIKASTHTATNIGAGLQTVYIPASAMAAPASGGGVYSVLEMANGGIYPVMSLSTTGFPVIAWQWEMPKGWNEGTLTYRVLWSHPATTTNFGVHFTVQAFAVGDGEALNGTYTTSTVVTDTGGSTDFKYTTPTSAAFTVDGSPAEGDLVVFRLFRFAADVLDTLAVDARIHGVALFYTTNANTDA